jgi:hypothetical protein
VRYFLRNTTNKRSRQNLKLKKHYEVRHKTLSPQTLKADIIPQLEAVGLIRQEADKEDRRRMLVYPTVSNYISFSNEKEKDEEEGEEEERNVDQDNGVDSSFFWETYDALEKQKQQPEPYGTVKESELKQALISSGKIQRRRSCTDCQGHDRQW